MSSSLQKKACFGTYIGNILEHYDKALYGLLAPFIAHLFFPHKDPMISLIYAYMLLPIGMISRPLGALFFGRIGDKYGRRKALCLSLFLTAASTFSLGCLPSYSQIGIASPILLSIFRMQLSFSAAGESVGAYIFTLENTSLKKRTLKGSIYGVSTILGVLLASALVYVCGLFFQLEKIWRIFFLLGGFTGFLGLYLRGKTQDIVDIKPSKEKKESTFVMIKKYRGPLFQIIKASGFSYMTYLVPFTFLIGYVPFVTNLSKMELLKLNTPLLIIDMMFLPVFGYFGSKIGDRRLMFIASISLTVLLVPMFILLDGAGLYLVASIRLFIVMLGVAYAAPYYSWSMKIVPEQHRFTLLALGSALGSQLIGLPTASICLWLYKITKNGAVPGLYLVFIAFLGLSALFQRKPARLYTTH